MSVGALAISVLVSGSAYAQDAQQKRKLNNDEKAQYEALKPLTDDVIAGKRPAPADAKIVWYNSFLRSAADLYTPYTIEVEAGKFTSFPVGFYVRAVKRAGPAPAAAAATPPPPFEDIALIQDLKDNRFSRAMQLSPGTYDIYVALRDKPSKGKNAAAPKVALLKQEVQVPDLFKGLTLSSVILADNIEAAPEPLTNDQQLKQPYVISGFRITPALNATFNKSGQFNFVFLVYNHGATAGDKPDVDAEFIFYKDEEKTPMVRMKPQSFNAQTLPPEFSMKAGHMLAVAQGVPLSSFAPGKYRFEITITDKTNNESVTRSENFTVTGS
jgi:hypothetical protein